MWGIVFSSLFLSLNLCSAGSWKEATVDKVQSPELAERHNATTTSKLKKIVIWHTIQFPGNSSPSIREYEDAPPVADVGDDSNNEGGDANTAQQCGAECSGYVNETVSKARAESEFAYEVFSDEGPDKVFEVDLDDKFVSYLNRWRDGESRLKRRARAEEWSSRRRRSVVIGDDTRFEITDREWLNVSPFSTNVRLLSGCSGVLISELHVLTAASCVHNGRKMTHKMRDYQVGVRQKRQLTPEEESGKDWKGAFRWFPVKKIFVPREWSSKPPKGQKGKVEPPADKNYAVIQLKRKVDRDFLSVSVGSVANVGEGKRIHFSSFDEEARPTLNYRFCKVQEETMEIIYQQCDGTPQSVGAGVYVRRWNRAKNDWERRVVGVFIGHQVLYEEDGSTRERNIAVKITPLKFAQICFWMTGDYGECRG